MKKIVLIALAFFLLVNSVNAIPQSASIIWCVPPCVSAEVPTAGVTKTYAFEVLEPVQSVNLIEIAKGEQKKIVFEVRNKRHFKKEIKPSFNYDSQTIIFTQDDQNYIFEAFETKKFFYFVEIPKQVGTKNTDFRITFSDGITSDAYKFKVTITQEKTVAFTILGLSEREMKTAGLIVFFVIVFLVLIVLRPMAVKQKTPSKDVQKAFKGGKD